MKLSHNVLVIQNLSIIPEFNDKGLIINAEMDATIKFYCSVNGNNFRNMLIKAEGQDFSDRDALKQAIQNFINGNFYCENRYYDMKIECLAWDKINHIDIQVGEPFKSLFQQIFDMSSWEIPRRELPDMHSHNDLICLNRIKQRMEENKQWNKTNNGRK